MINIDKMIMNARREQNPNKLSAYQLVKAKITEFKTQKNCPKYTDEVETKILRKMVKELKEDIEMYQENNRLDMYNQSVEQYSFIEPLIPAEPSKEDIKKYVSNKYSTISKKEMGLVIKEVKSKFPSADGGIVANIVKNHITE